MAFQRRKPAAIGTKASYPGFIEPALASSVDRVPSGERWLYEIKFDGYQVHLKDAAVACKTGLEGVVSKVRDARYASGRSNDWVKRTCAQREMLTIARFALDGRKWDGLYLGRRKGKDLI